ncbi:MAG: PHP domain-containing protein [Bacteroidota bacterium]|nr:PHP domain-containing protein [Bacteroidota bacterium]
MIYKADLHIHTVLSPCGDLDMSPSRIIKKAKEEGLDIIGITDHNSTLHGDLAAELGKKEGIFVLRGAEVTTKEEVHCLALFELSDQAKKFQKFLESRLPDIQNDPDYFGYQVVVDEEENILRMEPRLLISAIDADIDEVEANVHELNGLFIPAHIDRERFGIISQLGFFPASLKADAVEISARCKEEEFLYEHPEMKNFFRFRGSDAHWLNGIGTCYTELNLNELSFTAIRNFIFSQKK